MTKRSDIRRRRVGRPLALEIAAEDAEKTQVAGDMGVSRTTMHNVLEGRTRVTADFAVRLAAVLETYASRRAGCSGRVTPVKVRRRALEFMRLQDEQDLVEALGEADVRAVIAKLARPPAPEAR